MSFPLKRFIQGPNLHEESVSRNNEQAPLPPGRIALTGDEAKQIYDELVSSSAPSNLTSSTPISSTSSINVKKKKRVPKSVEPEEHITLLTLNQLMRLCETNDIKELQEYFQKCYQKININEQDLYGWTILMSAACAGSNDCVKFLLESGADWLLLDKKGLSAFDLARKNHRRESCNLIEQWQSYVANGCREIPDNDEGASSSTTSNVPVYCDACELTFSNQKEHLKSITHLFSSGVMNTDGKIHYGIPESNVGFQMMIKTGWDKDTGLGPDGKGQKFPVKTVLKRDRVGVGNDKDKKAARITHFAPFDTAAIDFPERIERTATQNRREEAYQRDRERRRAINFRRDLNLP